MDEKRDYRDTRYKIIIAVLLLFILILFGYIVFSNGTGKAIDAIKEEIKLAEDDSNMFLNTQEPIDHENQIEIPGYSDLKISKGSLVELKNPKENQVYLKYTISEGDTVLHESDYIKPGVPSAWNAGEDLTTPGEHELTFFVSTLSIETHQPQNTATIIVHASVQ